MRDKIPASFFDIVSAMKSRKALLAPIPPKSFPSATQFELVTVNAIEVEDGSGINWNITVQPAISGAPRVIFWRELAEPRLFTH
jgi:hypothetical protein